MNKPQQIGKITVPPSDSTSTPQKNTHIKHRVIFRLRAKAPARNRSEIPVLAILSRTPDMGVRTKIVLMEVKGAKWFSKLEDDDRNARYPGSRKKIVDSIIKWSKKNLVAKGEIFPPGDGCPVGVWKVTLRGLNRAKEEIGDWCPAYSIHDAIIFEEEK